MSEQAWLWVLMLIMGIITFTIRAAFLILPASTKMPETIERALKYVVAAVLPALVIPDVLFRAPPLGWAFDPVRLIAAAVAVVVALWTKNVLATLASGMAMLWLLKWLAWF
jgi:branched-subunit amino acid transport protein